MKKEYLTPIKKDCSSQTLSLLETAYTKINNNEESSKTNSYLLLMKKRRNNKNISNTNSIDNLSNTNI